MNTLQVLNKTWIPKIEVTGLIILVGGLVVSMILSFAELLDLAIGAGVALGTGFILGVAHYIFIYNFVRCPNCGENLALFKNGKKVPTRQLYNGFEEGKPCRHCGWSPSEGS